jgi:hypothetical protein
MKWMQHENDEAWKPAGAAIRAEFGSEGYGAYWIIREIIAKNADEKCCQITYPLTELRRILKFSYGKLKSFLDFCSENSIFCVEMSGHSVILEDAKLLKLQDEYTKKKARKNEKCPDSYNNTIQDNTLQNKTEEEKPPLSPLPGGNDDQPPAKPEVSADFERFWKAYPPRRKVGKLMAEKKFQALRKSGRLPPIDELLAILAHQARSPDWLKQGGEFIPAPLTWLNQGRWLDDTTPEKTPEREKDFGDEIRPIGFSLRH